MITEKDTFAFSQKVAEVELLNSNLLSAKNWLEKVHILDSNQIVKQFLVQYSFLNRLLVKFDASDQFLIKALLAIGQGPVVFQGLENREISFDQFAKFISWLGEIENFYKVIGGVVGYHLTVLRIIESKNTNQQPKQSGAFVSYHEPDGIDLLNDKRQSRRSVRWGIEQMEKMAEIYPIGGAGDRLNLLDETTGKALPAAQLLFGGRSLLEGMIRDLEGREFLHYKLFNKQIATPLAMMTSHEKNNHENILQICESNQWFGRDKSNFFFFIQVLVPMITEEGFWAMHEALTPILKPGGHGVIWKIALDKGLFEWLEQRGRSKAIMRQINNPVAGIDNGLLALSGFGLHEKKKFGFASCPRLLNMPEGMDVLCEKELHGEFEYCVTNIEYTEFEQRGICDSPKTQDSPFSQFPANTNILFVDLKAIKPIIEQCPIPGAIVNMKTKVSCLSPEGEKVQQYAGRLESTMQNIAGYIVDKFSKRLQKDQLVNLSTFLTYNERKKTISVTKQAFIPGKSILGTPEGCHFEMMQNYYDLLTNNCHFEMPLPSDEAAYLTFGPTVLASFHPALGMVYEVISQKIRGGHIANGSEWIMEIAEAEVVNLNLSGSLLIMAKSIMGKKQADGIVVYDSASCGKCRLINVTIQNQGISRSSKNIFWKHEIDRKESLKIVLHGNAEFFAENVHFVGNYHFEVPEGHRMIVEQKNHLIEWHLNKIDGPTWVWVYTFDEQDRIRLNIKYN
ncbi:MAG: UTP--glucose-1-phosphate uridylyltransferase [Parachlamydiaceae bacterium]|nr:UTP--glucose-1-phosphate uridylyltransferase [Parachlamydiaceae bacterium]